MPDLSTPAGLSPRSLHARAWVESYPLIDRQLSPLGLMAMSALALSPGKKALDIGCGAGQTLIQLAEMVGTDGRVVGIDIAEPLIVMARKRTLAFPNVNPTIISLYELANAIGVRVADLIADEAAAANESGPSDATEASRAGPKPDRI